MSALCDNITYVYGNEEYELVSDHQPTIEDTFTIKAEFVWMKDFKQYAPMGDVEVHGKKVSKIWLERLFAIRQYQQKFL